MDLSVSGSQTCNDEHMICKSLLDRQQQTLYYNEEGQTIRTKISHLLTQPITATRINNYTLYFIMLPTPSSVVLSSTGEAREGSRRWARYGRASYRGLEWEIVACYVARGARIAMV